MTCFYSKLVRLKVSAISGSVAVNEIEFLFQIGTIKRNGIQLTGGLGHVCFYSKLVRLKGIIQNPGTVRNMTFLFQIGTIKRFHYRRFWTWHVVFLFQIGTIKRTHAQQ